MGKFIKMKYLKVFGGISLILIMFSCKDNQVSSVSLNKQSSSLTIAQIDSLIPHISTDGDVTKIPVTWTSSNPAVVSVKNGGLQGLKVGSSTITAEAGGKMATCVVNVTDQLTPTFYKGILLYLGDY
jgi:uncharacterized protein YjdB